MQANLPENRPVARSALVLQRLVERVLAEAWPVMAPAVLLADASTSAAPPIIAKFAHTSWSLKRELTRYLQLQLSKMALEYSCSSRSLSLLERMVSAAVVSLSSVAAVAERKAQAAAISWTSQCPQKSLLGSNFDFGPGSAAAAAFPQQTCWYSAFALAYWRWNWQ